MFQFGKNSGARHMSVYGIAVSIVNKKKYSSDEVFRRDNAVLGLLAFSHQKFLTRMPTEVVERHLKELAAAGYGCTEMAADSIPEGLSFLNTVLA
jgi:hypothetical protein